MNKSIKTFVAGALLGAVVTAVPAFADDIYENISVIRNTLKVTIDGVKFDGDNFVYNDTTYVPLRAVSEALNKGVEYDKETNTAKIVTDCSFKFGGEVVGTVNGYSVTDGMYKAYEQHLTAVNTYATDEEKDTAIKNEIENNVFISQIADALGYHIDYSYVKNYDNMLQFIYMQNGGEEEFNKKAEQQGYSKDMFKHIREIEHLKSQIYGSEDFSELDNDKRVQLLDDIITEVKKEAVIKWN